MAFTKRMSDRWQASATYLLAGQWNLQTAPVRSAASTRRRSTPAGSRCATSRSSCIPTLVDEWYLTGDQRHRVTFNGIWDIGRRLPGERPVPLRRQRLGDADLRRRRAADRRSGAGRVRANGTLIARNSFDLPSMHRDGHARCRSASSSAGRKVDGHRRSVQRLQPRQLRQLRAEREQQPASGSPTQNLNVAYQPRHAAARIPDRLLIGGSPVSNRGTVLRPARTRTPGGLRNVVLDTRPGIWRRHDHRARRRRARARFSRRPRRFRSRKRRSPASIGPFSRARITCRGVVQAYLDRAKAYNGVVQLARHEGRRGHSGRRRDRCGPARR